LRTQIIDQVLVLITLGVGVLAHEGELRPEALDLGLERRRCACSRPQVRSVPLHIAAAGLGKRVEQVTLVARQRDKGRADIAPRPQATP
jgi:hypothetical protein